MKYLRYYVYLCILCAGALSCTSTPSTKGLYFPITVLAGVADLTVSTGGEMVSDSNDKTETFVRNARMGNNFLGIDTIKQDEQRKSPSEYDYLSNIRLQPRKNSTETTQQQRNNKGEVSSVQLQKGESFSMSIPMNKEVTIIAENKDSSELKFICTGKQFVVQQGETVMLHFR